MKDPYANARDVLPAALLREVQKHWHGLLWVPAPRRRRIKRKGLEERDRRIAQAYRRGRSVTEIAKIHSITEERVRQIVRTEKSHT